jgi:hypothetical protein
MNLPSKRVIIILLLIGLACLVMIVVNKNKLQGIQFPYMLQRSGFQNIEDREALAVLANKFENNIPLSRDESILASKMFIDMIVSNKNIDAAMRTNLIESKDKLNTLSQDELAEMTGQLFFAVIFMGTGNNNIVGIEGFQDTSEMDKIQADISQMSEAELKSTLEAMKARLTKYGLLPGDVEPQIDRSQWVPKTNIPPAGPRIDMSQYVKKSSIPPEKVCPPQKEIDYSEYVKKSTLPPTQKCPPCISPKVKVSAGLCKKCPPCPSCPPPQRCPEVQCPEPVPCPKVECPKCSEIKYIKVPTIITRTIKVDKDDKVISENVEEKEESHPATTKGPSMLNKVGRMFHKAPATTMPVETSEIPMTTRMENKKKAESCSVIGLNSDFKKFGIYGLE